MKKNKIPQVKKINELYLTLSKGYPIPQTNTKKDNVDNQQIAKLKALTLKNVRELIDNVEIKCSYIDYKPKYKKNILYVKKNDIVIAIASGNKKFDIMYIEEEPLEKFVYNNSCLVLRINEDIVNSKYVYLQLMTERVQEKLLQMAKGTKILHISKSDILKIEIPILEQQEMDRICQEYDKINEEREKIRQQQMHLWKKLNDLRGKVSWQSLERFINDSRSENS